MVGLFEGEAEFFGLVRADRYRLHGRPQLFVPGLERIGSRRQIAEIEASVFSGDRKIRVLEDRDVTLHPGMHVALHGNGDFLAREGLFHLRSRGLCLIPFTIIDGLGMNVMRGGVIVHQFEWLIGANCQDVWLVKAAFLLNYCRLSGWIELAVA